MPWPSIRTGNDAEALCGQRHSFAGECIRTTFHLGRLSTTVQISVRFATSAEVKSCWLAFAMVTIVACVHTGVHNWRYTYTLENVVNRAALTRTNLLLEVGKVRRLRKALRSRSNSEAVRRVIDERLAVETGLEALRSLRRLGAPDDVFGRAPAKKR